MSRESRPADPVAMILHGPVYRFQGCAIWPVESFVVHRTSGNFPWEILGVRDIAKISLPEIDSVIRQFPPGFFCQQPFRLAPLVN
jgi:hypothetical protein